MATTLKLVGPTMFRAFRCVWMLQELQVPYEHILAKPWSKQVKQYHPLGKIPVLIDGDFVLYESAAINSYLGDKFEQFVPPPRTKERARYDQTVLCLMTEMDAQGLWIHRKHQALAEYFGDCPGAVEEAKRQFDRVQNVMVQQLGDPGPYLLGNDFTAADILYVHCLDWAKSIGWFAGPQDQETNLQSYLELCKSRPAYQRTVAMRDAEQAAAKQEKLRSKI